MASVIATITFAEPVRVTDPGQAQSAGQLKFTMTGDSVFTLPSDVSEVKKWIRGGFKFRWEPYATIQALVDLWRNQIPFSASIEGIGVGTIYPSEGGGVSPPTNEFYGSDAPPEHIIGTFWDKWSGSISFTMKLS